VFYHKLKGGQYRVIQNARLQSVQELRQAKQRLAQRNILTPDGFHTRWLSIKLRYDALAPEVLREMNTPEVVSDREIISDALLVFGKSSEKPGPQSAAQRRVSLILMNVENWATTKNMYKKAESARESNSNI
jgi:hypothetical protein